MGRLAARRLLGNVLVCAYRVTVDVGFVSGARISSAAYYLFAGIASALLGKDRKPGRSWSASSSPSSVLAGGDVVSAFSSASSVKWHFWRILVSSC